MKHRLFEGRDDDLFLVTRDALKDLYWDGIFIDEQDYGGYGRVTFEGKVVEDGQAPMPPR